ncbi:ABC transporter permease [Streptomyces sp. VRA16 Mangrove soil]|uniref:ABC transporter permease n=1 Tax=Streptomyces sp. VRA16 Mangrove soil TaxID=2817434 RepID=UPI001A9D5807|nr:ABC transporter permease [Streptomyces sp. VRA16 Mangrove soil]MBO1331202.1 ABC transporter permease [Streptomyces sp. VRA16 Mangrove soil]
MTTTERVRFTDLLAAEWIKIRSLRSTPWILGVVVLTVLTAAGFAAYGDYQNYPRYSAQARRDHVWSLGDAFPAAGWLTLMLAAGSVGAIVAVSEYSSGLIRTTTVAVPARRQVVLAKAAVTALLWTAVGLVCALGSFALSQSILSGRDAAVSLGDVGSLRAVAASALLAPVCALIGLGLGVLVRHSATTMVGTAFTLLMLPTFFHSPRPWVERIDHVMVQSAWQRLVTLYGWGPEPYGGQTTAGAWTVFAVWPLAAVALALVVVRRRDV